jgi:isoamylase
MTQSDWDAGYARSLAVYLNGDAITEPDPRGNPVHDDRFLLLFNEGSEPITFTLPPPDFAATWHIIIDTTQSSPPRVEVKPRSELDVASHAVTVLRSAC